MLFIMLATLLLAVQIFGYLNCSLMRSVCLDPTLPLSLSLTLSASVVRHVWVRFVSVLFQAQSCLWEPFHVPVCACVCLAKLGFICQLPFSLCLQTNLPLVIASVCAGVCVCISVSRQDTSVCPTCVYLTTPFSSTNLPKLPHCHFLLPPPSAPFLAYAGHLSATPWP